MAELGISFWRTIISTLVALIAFASNSVLCRLALKEDTIDASGFTIVRLLSGCVVLMVILKFTNKKNNSSPKGNWIAPVMLFLYAVTFSFAYISLDTGTGALILFGSVQITIVLIAHFSGEKLYLLEWIGLFLALIGFVYLVLPGISTPSYTGFALMAGAGIAWGIYTLIGRKCKNPLLDTTQNFKRTLPFVIILLLFTFATHEIRLSPNGIFLAISSGGIASGIGYAIWYSGLRGLSSTQAGVVQLLVPVLAAFGGVLFVSEVISSRLIISAALILGGIAVLFIQHSNLIPE